MAAEKRWQKKVAAAEIIRKANPGNGREKRRKKKRGEK